MNPTPFAAPAAFAELSAGRVIPLPAFVVESLAAHQAAQAEVRKKASIWVQPGDLVFCDGNGQALPPNSVTRRFEQLAARAGLGHLRLHDLRHSAATIMLEAGVDQRTIQFILGHATDRQTRGYAHVVETMGRRAADAMQEAVG